MIWHFPLPRVHTGILLGNGTQGLMVWGGESLNITVGRAGFWDHRNGTEFTTRVNFSGLRKLLEAGDEQGVRAAFSKNQNEMGYRRPTQLGCGRIEISFHKNMHPTHAELDLRNASLTVHLANDAGETAMANIRQAMDAEVAWIACAEIAGIKTIPTWESIGELLAADGCKEPETWASHDAAGFCQGLPADDPLALAWHRRDGHIVIATALGPDAAPRARSMAEESDIHAATARSDTWWRKYRRDVPRVKLPDAALQEIWDYGIYKQAGLTTPGAIAATLQGPWMEDYQIPPWSNDYHFNINAQMIYWPALSTNRLSHFQPLWDLLRRWMPLLRENAAKFFGAQDALMLPHAVDDRCSVVGSFWTGTIDQACTAWMAQMAWLYYRYSLDEKFLRDLAWPMLTGAFNGYWAMIDEIEEDGVKKLSLPVSVSPEFGGAGMHAWGRNASFQLAACHFLANTLPLAAQILGKSEDPRWAEVRELLPPYTVNDPAHGIGLWHGQELSESHRHHSHLGALFPFRTVDPRDPAHRDVVLKSLRHWLHMGAGEWTGWCVPWASILCSRCEFADAAVAWLHWWRDVFTNIGRGTLHDADFPGAVTKDHDMLRGGNTAELVQTNLATPQNSGRAAEIMQMDAGMGAITAISELLVQCRGDLVAVLPAIPASWRELRFDGIRTEGAFIVGATLKNSRLCEVRVKSLACAHLKLAHGLGKTFVVNGERRTGTIFSTPATRGENFTLRTV